MWVPRKEWPVSQLTGIYSLVWVPRNLDSLFYNCAVFATSFFRVFFWRCEWVRTTPFTHQDQISCISNSCLNHISERFPYHLHGNPGCLKTFLDQGKRLLEGSRVQWRFRGTRNMLYTPVSCGADHSVRGTRIMPWTPVSCGIGHFFFGTSIKRERLLELCFGQQQTEIQQVCEAESQNERERVRDKVGELTNFRGRLKADQRAQCNFWGERAMNRWSNKISKVRSKWSPLKGKSCHLATEEWFFCSIRLFFEEIAILWRNSSILSDELTTIIVNV